MKYTFLVLLFIFSIAVILINPKITNAASSDIVILQVATASATSLSEEIIILYNTAANPVNVSGWCVNYSSSTDVTKKKLACIQNDQTNVALFLDPDGIVSFASGEFVISNAGFIPDFTFSSGMANSGGHVWVTDLEGKTIDRLGWGSAVNPENKPSVVHKSGESISRNYAENIIDNDDNSIDFLSLPIISPISSGLFEEDIIIDVCTNIDGIQTVLPGDYLFDENGLCQKDECPNIEELQLSVPIGFEKKLGNNFCEAIPLESSVLFITELLINAPSTDSGKEFIEIYNPNNKVVNLSGYILQVGPAFTKQFKITSGVIQPNEYIIFSDTETGIVLPNTSGVNLRLLAPNGDEVSSSPIYSNAKDDVSWALVEDQWIFTNQITPKAANKPYLVPATDEVSGVTSLLAPCPAGKFRNPETNRCKSLENVVSNLKPCDEDEFRNPLTNRCNKLSSTTSSLTPCKPGQERNPETNRCRKVATTSSLAPCPEGQERNLETNRCRKVSVLGASTNEIPTITDVAVENTTGRLNWPLISITIFATFGYILYEWRSEVAHSYGRIRTKLVQ